jgi:dTDP-glucose 4,6-dehydratase/UDP-glucose 4-epimerase
MKYLVTGGCGFIGSALVRRLLADEHEVTVLDRMSRGRADRLEGLDCRVLKGDIRDEDTVKWAVRSADAEAVVHLAYVQGTQTFYTEPRTVLDVALRGILNVLGACEDQDVRELCLVSSSEAYQVASIVPTPETIPLTVPDPLNPRYSYGGGKIACELAAVAWQLNGALERVTIVRPHNVYGPDMGREHVIPEFALRMNKLVQDHEDGGVIPFPIQGSGQETRSFCYIDDAIEQFRVLLARGQAGTEIWNVGTMQERTIAQVAHAVAACYGREIEIQPGKLPEGSPPRRLPDTQKMTALGVVPQMPFTEGVRKAVAWYQQHG